MGGREGGGAREGWEGGREGVMQSAKCGRTAGLIGPNLAHMRIHLGIGIG